MMTKSVGKGSSMFHHFYNSTKGMLGKESKQKPMYSIQIILNGTVTLLKSQHFSKFFSSCAVGRGKEP